MVQGHVTEIRLMNISCIFYVYNLYKKHDARSKNALCIKKEERCWGGGNAGVARPAGECQQA